ncbi:hypothetical protein OPT61_g819 [Boeremia exigua]|uniref:Uncharacterized protein n=1 Tax=Boeremia exigua TaxID=749465 RepID=A0ACC2ISL7_9PLEO|nr:hypothetical protein OPT61_g819 [Boeremia exigua]
MSHSATSKPNVYAGWPLDNGRIAALYFVDRGCALIAAIARRRRECAWTEEITFEVPIGLFVELLNTSWLFCTCGRVLLAKLHIGRVTRRVICGAGRAELSSWMLIAVLIAKLNIHRCMVCVLLLCCGLALQWRPEWRHSLVRVRQSARTATTVSPFQASRYTAASSAVTTTEQLRRCDTRIFRTPLTSIRKPRRPPPATAAMRSLFTPSRIVVMVTTFTLICFLWTYGLPSQLTESPKPIIQHPADEAKLRNPTVSAPVVRTSYAASLDSKPTPTSKDTQLKEDDGHRWDDKTRKSSHVGEQTPLFGSKETGSAGHEKSDKAPSQIASATPDPALEATSSVNNTSATSTSFVPYVHTAAPVKGFCKNIRRAEDVMVVVKTSKAEIFDKLSGHLSGLLSCVPNFAIFSDHAGEIDGIPVYDALRGISLETQEHNEEFREYKIIKEDPEYKPDAKKTKDLDKWKILTMVYDAYRMNPHARFYAFIEADTGLSWSNLLQWVDRLDYRIPYYNGAQTAINHVQFAQRGPGILLSQGALRLYARSYEERWANQWQKRLSKECCGDYMLATAMNDAHVELYKSWPLMQGEQPDTLDYTMKQWCSPAVTWHQMDNDALEKNWELQKKWTKKHGWERPYLHRDAYAEYVQPYLKAQVEDWDNLSSDTKITSTPRRRSEKKEDAGGGKKADEKADTKGEDEKEGTDWDTIDTMVKDGASSPEKCKDVCLEVEDCLQWRHTPNSGGECHLSKVIKLGKAVKREEGAQQWVSGWMLDRIKVTTKSWVCKEVNWKFYQ